MSLVPFLNITTNIIPPTVTSDPTKACLIVGQRNTNGNFIASPIGNQPDYYKPFLIPSFTNGLSALRYLSENYGLVYQMGINFTLALPAPTTVTNSNGLTILTWSTIPNNFVTLTGFALTGILGQTTPTIVSGTIKEAKIVSGVATMYISGTVTFITAGSSGGALTLNGTNNIDYPDPNLTDPICLMAWDFYQTALSSPTTTGNAAPFLYLSILSDRDSTINPSNTPIVLGNPASVSTVSGVATLTYPLTTTNLGYLPTTALGTTVVDQAVSGATGVYQGYTVSGSNMLITVNVTTGVFVTGDSVSVVLDNTTSFYDYINNIDLFASVLQFPVTDANSINVTQGTFFNGNLLINQPNQVLNNHYFTYAVAGNVTSIPSQAGTLPNINSQYDIFVTYPYYPKFGDIPYDDMLGNVASGRIAAARTYVAANRGTPYFSDSEVNISHLPVATNWKTYNYSSAVGGNGAIAVSNGWSPLYVGQTGVVTILQSNTSLTTIPNTTVPDFEFSYLHIWDSIRYLRRKATQVWKEVTILPNNAGMQNMSPRYIRQLRAAMLSMLKVAESDGVIQNLSLYQNLLTVAQDVNNPNQVDVVIPAQLIAQVNGANIQLNIFSATLTSF